MVRMTLRLAALVLIGGVAACAGGDQPGAPAAAPPVAAQAAPSPAAATAKLACLDQPNYATMPLPPSGRRGRVAQWLARPDGSGCHWTRSAI